MTDSERTPTPATLVDPLPPFVGRAVELERLGGLLDRALHGFGSIVLVTGESGIGKTTLVSEFLRRTRQRDPSMVLCRGRCVEQHGTGEPYLPFLDALGTLLLGKGRDPTSALLAKHAPTWWAYLGRKSASGVSGKTPERAPAAATERMLREMGDLFEATADDALMVAFLEDVQWADASTADTVRHLMNRIARQRIILIGTLRPGEVDVPAHPLKSFIADLRTHSLCREIALGPFAPDDVATYLSTFFGPSHLPAGVADLVYRRTAGQPFFVASLVQLLAERGDVVRSPTGWALSRPLGETAFDDAPPSVRALVRGRIASLEETDRRALQYASVMGVEFQSAALAAVLKTDQAALEERLDQLDRVRRLIDTLGEEELPEGGVATRYRFSQELYREVAYGELVSQRRVQMHREVAQALRGIHGVQAPRLAASLAYHFERGRDFGAAVAYLIQAAENSEHLNAVEQAAHYLSHALTLVEKLPGAERTEQAILLHEKCGRAHLSTSGFDEAAASFTRMLRLAREAANPSLESQALSGVCQALFFSHRIEEMAVRAAEALAAAERSGRDALRAEAMLLIAQILQHDGNLRECTSILEGVVDLAQACGHRRALAVSLAYRGVVHYWQSEYLAAEERLTQALPIATELHDGLVALVCLQFLGLARGNRGLMSQALAFLAEGIDLGRKSGDRFWLPRLASHVGWVHRELEDFEGAIVHDSEALELSRECRVAPAESGALLNLSLDYIRSGRLEEAREILRDLEERSDEADWFGWLHQIRLESALSEYWMARRDAMRSSQHATRLLDLSTPRGAQIYVATAHRVLFDAALAAGDRARAVSHAEAAAAALASTPSPNYGWRLHAAVGRLHEALGDAPAARLAFEQSARDVGRVAAGVTDPGLQTIFLSSPAVRAVLGRESHP